MTKIEIKLHWGLDKKPLETAFNKQIQQCFEEKDLKRITLATISFPELGIAGEGLEYELTYSGGGLLAIELVKDS